MTMQEKVKQLVRDAMKAKDLIRRDVLRCVATEADALELKQGKALTDDQVLKVMQGIVANNDKTLHGYTDKEGKFWPGIDQRITTATGADLESCETQRAKLTAENAVLNEYIPKTLTIDEVRVALAPLADAIKAADGDKKAMGVAMPFFKKGGQLVNSLEVEAVVKEIRSS